MVKRFSAALFDLDGVLIDTEPTYTRIWSDIESHFPTGIENFALKIKGNTLPRILSTYFPDENVQQQVRQMLFEREEAMEYELFEGAMDFLEDLAVHNIPAAIVTSSGDAKMQRIFNAKPRFASMFKALVTDSCVSRSKPDPECYLTGARMLGFDAGHCFVFEDSYAGLQAGRASGATVVALATSNPRESLIDKADIVVDSIMDLSVERLLESL